MGEITDRITHFIPLCDSSKSAYRGIFSPFTMAYQRC